MSTGITENEPLSEERQLEIKKMEALLKKRLLEGEVTFVFKKNDGTDRTARGTLASALLPEKPKDKVTKVKCFDIEWDALDEDKKKNKLPDHAYVKVTNIDDMSPDEIKKDLSEWLEENYKFSVKSFKHEKVEPKKKPLAEGQIFFYDLDKAGWRSCAAGSLLKILD